MAEGTEKNEDAVKVEREEIFSNAVRAGKRTYFFDVKTTRSELSIFSFKKQPCSSTQTAV